ncbi:MAG: OmpA family protein [Gemmatimonadota bacterium]|jgi:peptidoglycan-associated lipoprotein
MQHVFSRPSRLLTLAAVVGLAACGKVGQEDYQADMEQLRADIQAADRANASRIDEVESSVAALEQQMNALESQLQSMANEFDATVSRLEASLRFATPVHFGFDQDEVRAQDMEVLRRFASVVREYYPGAMVTVEGFTDPSGPAAYNLQLGQRRADSVREILVGEGLMDGNVRAVSYGEDTSRLVMPGASGEDDMQAMMNRRVVLVVDHAGGTGMTS